MKDSLYHIVLRTTALTLALVLLFVSGILSSTTAQISQNTESYIATAIGMQASVVPTELNQYTAELTARDHVLTQRESDVTQREIAVDLAKSAKSPDYSTYIISVLLFVILVLIVLNYALDYMRAREQIMSHKNAKVA